jgi:nucleoside-diphosphate-sugar epimerase
VQPHQGAEDRSAPPSRLNEAFWRNRPVLVTGGASFIGSHLTDALVRRGAQVVVADDLSSGNIGNIGGHVSSGRIAFLQVDLSVPSETEKLCAGIDTIFHLAAAHGGRGYLETHQAACAGNLVLDGVVFRAAVKKRVRKVVYASSGCVYPLDLQGDPSREILLTEDMVGPPYQADGMYGWAKLMGELTLRTLCQETGLGGVSCRYFTVYGPRSNESHAITAMMARALVGQDPFVIWGDGRQVRNWTYVSDIARGTILAAETIDDGTAINLGSSEQVTILGAARMILELARRQPQLEFRPWMPTGPQNRVASSELAQELLDWTPKFPFQKGLRKTFRWYRQSKKKGEPDKQLDSLLLEREVPETQRHPVLEGGRGLNAVRVKRGPG